ncbi:pollen-specific leucine-rich repeat extensin-like protein 3 [Iris pallida]|uniref:Pollen-specific leucine-rich repeat extensin-like protein 3 n=1 Tax=Iris pallida TaxID=29817 RepID=A0AAX6GLU9_IRIPA|nr:pollen-specific leucine-rich repeat extensin-like protein 3 [Iris pallida]
MAATLAVLCRRASPEPPASSILTNDRHPPFIPFHRPPSPTSSPSPPPQLPHLHHHHHPLSIPTKPPPPRREPSQASPPFQPPAEPGLTAIVGRSKASTATTNHIPSMSTRSRSETTNPTYPELCSRAPRRVDDSFVRQPRQRLCAADLGISTRSAVSIM